MSLKVQNLKNYSRNMLQKNLAYNSNTEIYTENGIKYIRKTFRLAMSRQEAEEVRQKVLMQRHAFENMRVPTSKMVDIDLKQDGTSNDFRLTITEVFAGLDFMDVVDNENFSMYFDRLLDDIFKPLLKSNDNNLLPAGIDGSLRNFVYDNKHGEFCYVDFLPPKVFYKGKYTQEIPEITDADFYEIRKISHNHKDGIVYNLYINTLREFPEQLKYLPGRLEQYLKEIKEEKLFTMIQESALYRVHDPIEIQKIINSIKSWSGQNFFLIREIGNWFHSQNPELSELKKEIFKLTSQERNPDSPDYGKISKESFDAVIKLLKEGVRKCV